MFFTTPSPKIIEEAPAPNLSDDLRYELGETAIKAAKAVKYRGAGTVEFIVDVEHNIKEAPFYFMEMNTRLQVEHPVTELITGLDLVEWQLRVAAGERLPLFQKDIKVRGHAFEARLYAEDPENNFLPQMGKLHHFKTPPEDNYFRLDTGVDEMDEVSVYYDPLLAKFIVWGNNRSEALRHMRRVIKNSAVAGVKTNLEFLYNICNHASFRVADINTGFIEKYKSDLIRSTNKVSVEILALATMAELMPHISGDDIWDMSDGWLLNLNLQAMVTFLDHGKKTDVFVTYLASGFKLGIDGQEYKVDLLENENFDLSLLLNGTKVKGKVIRQNNDFSVFYEGAVAHLHHFIPGADKEQNGAGSGSIKTPMPGKITRLFVKQGDEVQKGQTLMILEAMKMEHMIKSPYAGNVTTMSFKEGMQVEDGQTLIKIEEAEKTSSERDA